VQSPSFLPYALLVLFTEGKAELTREQFDTAFDEVLATLEAANNEKHRLVGPEPEAP